MEAPSAPPLDAVCELVTVVHRLDKSKLLRGVSNKFNVVLCLQTGTMSDEVGEKVLEVCLCLDVSGSMSGEKLQHSKQAFCQVLSSLKKNDVVCAVAYSTVAEAVFERTRMSGDGDQLTELISKVNNLKADGSTNMSDGMTKALQLLLADDHHPKAKGAAAVVRRIFLFSDGVANRGINTAHGLGDLALSIYEKGITISTFGLGKGFNEDVMHRIAKDGHGYFAYCRKASQIPKFVAEALSQTQRIVGTNAKLVFQGLGCSILSKIYKHKNNVALLNDLKQNNSITIACKMKSMPTHQTPDVEDVLKWKLSYINAITGGVEESEGMVKAEFTSDLDSAQQPGDAPANACVLQIKAALLDSEILACLDANDRAGAIRLAKQAIEYLEKAAILNPQGYAPVMLKSSMRTLKKMEKNKNGKSVRKAAHYQGYLHRMDSSDAIHAAADYAADESKSDSDESSDEDNASTLKQNGRRQLFDSGDWAGI